MALANKKFEKFHKIIFVIKTLHNTKSVSKIKRLLCGELLGSGCYRDVYVLKQNPDYVIKIEREMDNGIFCNVTEFRNWINYRDWKFLAEWLAPCEFISDNGQVLIQHRVYWDGKKRKDYPKHIPSLFTDTKLRNFGWLKNGRFVCNDYPFFIILTKNQWKTAKWIGRMKSYLPGGNH